MQRFVVSCDKQPTNLKIGVEVKRPTKVMIRVFNPDKPNTFYLDRWNTVQKTGEFEARMPQTCDKVIVEIRSIDGNDQNIRITKLQKAKLEQYIPCLSGKGVPSFVKFAQEFCENASVLQPNVSYFSDDKKYQIDYMKVITENGRVERTPARISNKTGRMEVSKDHFVTYSVPMRMAILLHEFSHFYLNVVTQDEVEADLNALKIYLGMGYPIIEAHKSFLNVFKKTPSKQNHERYEYLKAFIDNFESMKYTLCLP
jgi:hypothetical protein